VQHVCSVYVRHIMYATSCLLHYVTVSHSTYDMCATYMFRVCVPHYVCHIMYATLCHGIPQYVCNIYVPCMCATVCMPHCVCHIMSRYATVSTPQYVCHSMCTPLKDAPVYVCARVRVCGCVYVFMYVCVYLRACVRASMCVCHMMYVYVCLSRQHHSTVARAMIHRGTCNAVFVRVRQLRNMIARYLFRDEFHVQ